jgi:hypothetical protein
VSRFIGPQRSRALTGGATKHVASRIPRTCERCGDKIPAGVRHVVNTATPAYAHELGYGRHWLTMHTCGESPRACYRTSQEAGQ